MLGKRSVIVFFSTVVFVVFLLVRYENSMAGMSSVDVGMGASYDFSDKKYGSHSLQKGDHSEAEVAAGSNKLNRAKHEQGNDTSLVARLHYTYTYNANDSLELFFAPSVHYESGDEGEEVSLQYNDVRGSFFKDITESWSFFGENTFSLTEKSAEDTDKKDSNSTRKDSAAAEPVAKNGNPAAAPSIDEENDGILYYRNHAALNTRYLYGQADSLQFGVSYDLLREDSDAVDLQTNDYDRYTVQTENRHRFNSNWGTTLRGSYVRGEYKGQKKQKEMATAGAGKHAAAAPTGKQKKRIDNDVSEYRLSGSIIHFFNEENTFTLEYGYTRAAYDGEERNDATIYMGQLRWRHRFSTMLENSFGIGSSGREVDGGDNHFGLNGIVELRYLQKLGSYSFLITKNYDVENFDGTDKRGPVGRLSYSLNIDRLLSNRLSLRGSLEYSEEQSDESTSTDEKEHSEDYEKNIWRASLGVKYRLLEEVDAGFRYSFSCLNAENETDSYDEHRVMVTLDWAREWLRW